MKQGERVGTRRRAEAVAESKRKTLCIILYVGRTSDIMGNICREYGLQPVFKQRSPLRELLMQMKGPQKHVNKSVV